MHVRSKCCDDRFTANPQYMFQTLDFIEIDVAASSVHFAE